MHALLPCLAPLQTRQSTGDRTGCLSFPLSDSPQGPRQDVTGFASQARFWTDGGHSYSPAPPGGERRPRQPQRAGGHPRPPGSPTGGGGRPRRAPPAPLTYRVLALRPPTPLTDAARRRHLLGAPRAPARPRRGRAELSRGGSAGGAGSGWAHSAGSRPAALLRRAAALWGAGAGRACSRCVVAAPPRGTAGLPGTLGWGKGVPAALLLLLPDRDSLLRARTRRPAWPQPPQAGRPAEGGARAWLFTGTAMGKGHFWESTVKRQSTTVTLRHFLQCKGTTSLSGWLHWYLCASSQVSTI